MMYVLNNSKEVFDPFYQTGIQAHPWEFELLQSRAVRRLKFLSHYGTSTFITSAKHSRFEHTLGVWTIISTFFPHEEELRIAALLHDIGHLPFSHAVERTLGFNHHQITEGYIHGDEVTSILHKYGFEPARIIDLLNQDTPLSHNTPYLSADHLDSFLRDSYMLGRCTEQPSSVLRNLSFNGNYVDASLQTSRTIMEAIYVDHTSFLAPISLSLDAILAKGITIFAKETDMELDKIPSLTNNELLQLLLGCENGKVKDIMDIILWNPERVQILEDGGNGADVVEVKKIYDKTPLADGEPLTSVCPRSKFLLDAIRSLKKSYYFTY